jgi:CSLREA domain-containing protein
MTSLFRHFRKASPPLPSARARLAVEQLEGRTTPALMVNTLADEIDPNDGLLSLREAVAFANSDTDNTLITFAPGLAGTITLANDQMIVTQPVTITGPGAGVLTVSGNNLSRIFEINNGTAAVVTASISGLTLTGGNGANNGPGGAVFVADEALTLSGVVVTGNKAAGGAGIYVGPNGRLTLENSTVSNNTSGGLGGGLRLDINSVTLIRNSTVSGNQSTAGAGGGIGAFTGASLTVENTTIAGNHTTSNNNGGGISAPFHGTLVVRNSTISGNQAKGGLGGGMVAFDTATTIENSTISGNSAKLGGGVSVSQGATVVRNSTVAFNTADSDNVNQAFGGGIFIFDSATAVTLLSTIVADNAVGATGADPDISGLLTAAFSLVEDTIGTVFAAGSANNLTGLDPLLGPLQFNGGPTKTHALLAGSPAINHGANPLSLSTDQRGPGFRRAAGGAVDIGAFEVQSPLSATDRALQAAVQLIRMLQPSGARLAAATFADLNGDFARDIILAFKLKSGRLLLVTLSGVDGRVLGAFVPFPAKLKAGARVQLLTADLNGDGAPEIALVIGNGGLGVPRISAFTAAGRRVL